MPIKKRQVLLVIESSTGYGRGIFRGITRYVRQTNRWRINIENRGFNDPLPTWLADWDGVISRSGDTKTLRFIHRLGVPVVELHGDGEKFLPEVYCSEEAVAQSAADHLLASGRRSLAFYSYGRSWWLDQRREAFVENLRARGFSVLLPPNEPVSDEESGTKTETAWGKSGETRLLAWLKKLPKPVSIFTGYDPVAIRVINACARLGYSIPQDVAVLGAGNDEHLCEAITPTLTSIDMDPIRIGYDAARLLDEKMSRKSAVHSKSAVKAPFYQQLIDSIRVVPRESTDTLLDDADDIVQAVRYLRENALSGIKISDLALSLHLSTKSLQRGIRRLLGRTPEQELIRLKMEAASALLRDSHLSLTEIARRCGFSSTKYFVNAFRHYFQKTPNQFRQEIGS